MIKCECTDWEKNMPKINAPFLMRQTAIGEYDGMPFAYCPWCGNSVTNKQSIEKNNLFQLGGITKLDISPDRILENTKGILQGLVLIGFDKNGQVFASSSYADGGAVLWLLEACKTKMMQAVSK